MIPPAGGGSSLDVQRVPFRNITRAAFVRQRVPLLMVMGLLLAAAGAIFWLVNGIMVPTTPPVISSQQVLIIRLVIFAVPALIAALAGAPLLASEYESGTFRFTQTQGAGRRRLLLGTLLVYVVTITVGASVVALSISRFYRVLNDHKDFTPWRTPTFFSQPLLFVLMTVATFFLGVVAGALLKKNVASITATVSALVTAAVLVTFEGYHWTLTWLAKTAETNDPGFMHLATYRLFGATSASELYSRSYLVRTWMENGRGQQVSALMAPAQFEVLHLSRHYTFWAQVVSGSEYHAAQLIWLAITLAFTLAAIVAVFACVGGRDRLFSAAAREDRRTPLTPQTLVHEGGERL